MTKPERATGLPIRIFRLMYLHGKVKLRSSEPISNLDPACSQLYAKRSFPNSSIFFGSNSLASCVSICARSLVQETNHSITYDKFVPVAFDVLHTVLVQKAVQKPRIQS